jgi:hypothetical protein
MALAAGDDGGRLASGDDGGRLAAGDDGDRLGSASLAAASFASVTLRMPCALELALERLALDLNSAPRIGGIYR